MEEKKYPVLDEDSSSQDVAAETTGLTMTSVDNVKSADTFIPVGVPRTEEDALSDIEEGEREFERGETFSHKEVMRMMRDKIDRYAGKV